MLKMCFAAQNTFFYKKIKSNVVYSCHKNFLKKNTYLTILFCKCMVVSTFFNFYIKNFELSINIHLHDLLTRQTIVFTE